VGDRVFALAANVIFREDAQKTRTGNQPNAHAAVRNLVTG
jgi:hypothetical protein